MHDHARAGRLRACFWSMGIVAATELLLETLAIRKASKALRITRRKIRCKVLMVNFNVST